MPEWLQVLMVIVSITLVSIALFALHFLRRLVDKASADLTQLTRAVCDSAARIDRAATEAGSLLTEVRGIVSPVQRAAQRFEGLTSSLLDEVEPPLQTATAFLRGFRTGTGHFIERVMRRFTQLPVHLDHEGANHER